VGRDSRFGLDHLVQLLAVRVLLRSQKWSLPAIKSSFATTETQDLLNGLLAPVRRSIESEYKRAVGAVRQSPRVTADQVRTPELNPAQLLIERFKAGKPSRAKPSEMPMFSRTAHASQAAASPVPQRSGNINRKLHFELEPWCEVVIDAQRMESLSPTEIERLGEALKSRLKDEAAR
jgi:hypothetical protein